MSDERPMRMAHAFKPTDLFPSCRVADDQDRPSPDELNVLRSPFSLLLLHLDGLALSETELSTHAPKQLGRGAVRSEGVVPVSLRD